MEISQFALYQLKNIPENRMIRYRSYKTLQEQHIPVRYANYEQVYLGRMKKGIRRTRSGSAWGSIRPADLPATA